MVGWSSANPCKPFRCEVFLCDPCARTLHQILHLDLDIQYSPKIPNSQELVKFDFYMMGNMQYIVMRYKKIPQLYLAAICT